MGLETTDHQVSVPPVLLSLCTELCTQMCACQESQPHGPQASSQTCHSISGAPSASPTPSCPWGGGETGLEKEPQAWSCRTLKGAPFSYHHPRSYRPAGLSEHKTSLPKLEGHKNPGSRGLRPGSRWDWAAKSNLEGISMPSKTYPQCHRDNLTQEGSASLRSQRQEEGASSAHSLNSTEN